MYIIWKVGRDNFLRIGDVRPAFAGDHCSYSKIPTKFSRESRSKKMNYGGAVS